MIQNINLLIALMSGGFIFAYFTNSVFEPRRSYLFANIGTTIGYILLYLISLLYNPNINMICFVVVNFALLYLCFKIKLKNAIIQIFILTAIMMLSEALVSMLTNIGVFGLSDASLTSRIIHVVPSKLIYFIGVVIDRYISYDKAEHKDINSFWGLIIMPFFTIVCITAIMLVFEDIDEMMRRILAVISVFGVVANVIVYWIYERTLMYQKEVRKLQEQQYKNTIELTYCNMLEEKLSQARIMRHDFREHLSILEKYMQTDNNSAMDYLQSIEIKNEEIGIVNYTKNKVLNILFSEKQKKCTEKGIKLKIHTTDVNFDFMKDIDIVSIFSNLLNNAIESCEHSENKLIYVNLYKMNNNFVIIKIENSCDESPIKENGFYKTSKISKGEHGIGLKSVVKALKQYNGDLRIEYNGEEKVFTAMAMMSLI